MINKKIILSLVFFLAVVIFGGSVNSASAEVVQGTSEYDTCMKNGGDAVGCAGMPGDPKKASMGGIDIPENTGLSDTPIADILKNLLTWLLGIVGVIALIGFVISGIQYIIASGNEDMMESAKRNMMYSIIGIAVALGSVVIVKAIDLALQAKSF